MGPPTLTEPQVEEFRYLEVWFMSEERTEPWTDSNVALQQVVGVREVYVPANTCGQDTGQEPAEELHLVTMTPGLLPGRRFRHVPNPNPNKADSERDHICQLVWKHLSVLLEELDGDRKVWLTPMT